jgi:nucleoside-diphosphate-sugar epimerase
MTLLGKTVLVTGATGLLGGALAKRLAADGAVVRALARHPERERFLRGVDGITLVQGDITDKHRMHDVTQGCDIVFHAAAIADGALAIQREINVEGTRNVMQAAAEAHAQRIVHVSTLAVYGFRERGDISEDMSLEPEHAAYAAYGITKAEAESVVRSIAHKHELDYSILRPGMIYGHDLWAAQHQLDGRHVQDGEAQTHDFYW